MHFQCNNQKSCGYAFGTVICWDRTGPGPPCCCSLCHRGLLHFCVIDSKIFYFLFFVSGCWCKDMLLSYLILSHLCNRFLLPLWGVPTEALFKLQHVLELWGPCLLESLSKILPAGKIRILDSSASVFHVWQFDVLFNYMCSGGVSVFGYLQFHLQYLLLPWCFVQKVPIGYTRFVFICFPCPEMIIIIIFKCLYRNCFLLLFVYPGCSLSILRIFQFKNCFLLLRMNEVLKILIQMVLKILCKMNRNASRYRALICHHFF